MLKVYEFLSKGVKIKRSDLENKLENYGGLLEFEISKPELYEFEFIEDGELSKKKLYSSSFVGKRKGEEITRGKIMSRGKRSDSFVLEWHVLTRVAGILKGFKDYSLKVYEDCKK